MTFPIRFLICNLFICVLLGCILLSKRVFKKHMTVGMQYHLWYVFVFALMVPFIPVRVFTPGKLYLRIQQLFSQAFDAASPAFTGSTPGPSASANPEIWDLSADIVPLSSLTGLILCGIWILGMLLASIYFIHTSLNVYFLRKHAFLITGQTEPELYSQFSACLKELHIRRRIRLYASCSLSTPVSYGWLRPTVIIPQDLDILLSEEEVRFIFLHELQHYRHRDAIFNDLVCLMQILYWFNPLIWYGFGKLRKDREIACDHAVIHVIGEDHCREYGYTILRYAEQMKKGMFLTPLSTLGGSKNAIKLRILEIADYKKDSASKKGKSAGVMALILMLVYCLSPLLTAHASLDSNFSMQDENWEEIDLSPYFDGLDGSFVLYDISGGQYQIYQKEFSEQRVSPDSTFKIYSGLFALEEHHITPESTMLSWNQSEQPFREWMQDQTLGSAMKHSVNWYFQDLDRQSGLSVLSSYYQKISYGNCDLTGGVDSYWAESSLKISPVEQVMLLADLLENQWGFDSQNIKAVKDALYLSDTPFGKLYGKTGTGMVNGQNINGWFVGFLENNGHTYCFATNLRNSGAASKKPGSENPAGMNSADGTTAARITTEILTDLF